MSAPENTEVLSFEQRLQLVREEISHRTKHEQLSDPYAFQARLWCHWLMLEVV